MNGQNEKAHEPSSNEKPDTVTRALMSYSHWRRRRLVAESKVPIRLLIYRTAFLTGCILFDGVLLPWVIIALNRTTLSYAFFATVLVVAVVLQTRFYFRWKQTR